MESSVNIQLRDTEELSEESSELGWPPVGDSSQELEGGEGRGDCFLNKS